MFGSYSKKTRCRKAPWGNGGEWRTLGIRYYLKQVLLTSLGLRAPYFPFVPLEPFLLHSALCSRGAELRRPNPGVPLSLGFQLWLALRRPSRKSKAERRALLGYLLPWLPPCGVGPGWPQLVTALEAPALAEETLSSGLSLSRLLRSLSPLDPPPQRLLMVTESHSP